MQQSADSGVEPSREDVDQLEGPTVIEFGAPWCGYCMAARPLIDQALAKHSNVRHLRIEDGPGRRLGRSFRVKLWPTLVFLRQGVEVERLVRPSDSSTIEGALARIDGVA
ncbi:thioredoxin family protein [Aromatoleum diolicum]|uniref:thioredoxin family protein n=1 Tax=Aromatoleum diolicum TaxID=75796 RepID=UPI003CCCC2A2